jgi:glycogen(starch) synthase
MKILIATTYGVTRFFRNWPEALLARALARRGHQVTALTYFEAKSRELNPGEEEIDGVRVKRIAPHGWYTRELAHALARMPHPDVLHVFHLRNYFAFQTAWQMRRAGVPLVVTPIGPLHDPYLVSNRDRPLDAPPRWSNLILSRRALLSRIARDGRVKRHLENYLMHWPLEHADGVIACSDHERDLWKCIQVESETIPLWIDQAFIRAHAGEKYPARFGSPIILFVAQLKYRKGFDLLARAMAGVTSQFPSATFVFVSHSPIHRRELEEIARETGTLGNLKVIERAT